MHGCMCRFFFGICSGKHLAFHNKRIYGSPEDVLSFSDWLWNRNEFDLCYFGNAQKTSYFMQAITKKQPGEKSACLFYRCHVMCQCRRNRTWHLCGKGMPFLLVGLFMDSLPYHAIHLSPNKLHVWHLNYILYGSDFYATVQLLS